MASSDFEGPSTAAATAAAAAAATTPSSTARAACAWASCRMEFASFHQLAAHLSKDHIAADSSLQPVCEWRRCPHAGPPMPSRYHLITHMRTHTGDRSFLCPFDACGKVYKRTDFLKRHIETHAASAGTPAPDPNAPDADYPGSAPRSKRRHRRGGQASAGAAAAGWGVSANSDNESRSGHAFGHEVVGYSNERMSPVNALSLAARPRRKRKSRHAYTGHESSGASVNSNSNSDVDVDSASDNGNDSDGHERESRRKIAPSLLDPVPESEQLVAMLQAQLDYISSQVDDRKEKLARAKAKMRR
ncbi:Zinc finger protein ZIC 4, partial [Coemansia sp. RSA 2599]